MAELLTLVKESRGGKGQSLNVKLPAKVAGHIVTVRADIDIEDLTNPALAFDFALWVSDDAQRAEKWHHLVSATWVGHEKNTAMPEFAFDADYVAGKHARIEVTPNAPMKVGLSLHLDAGKVA